MPPARTTPQRSLVRAALGRTPVLVVLAVVLAAVLALLGPGLAVPAQAAGAGQPTTAQRGPAGVVSPAGSTGPTTAPGGSVGGTSPDGSTGPNRLDGPVTPRRYGLPTVLAVVLVLGVASLQVRLLLAEPAARRPAPPAAPRTARERRNGVRSPRW